MSNVRELFIYIISCIIFSLGATSFILSDLGTDPLDVFCLGVQMHTGWLIGTIQCAFALVCLGIWSFLNKKIPPFSTFITFFLCGYMIDFFRYYLASYVSDISGIILMLIGTILCVQGSAGIIISGYGIRAMDLIALSLQDLTKKPFWIYKGIAEAGLLISGWILGGPVGIGTIIFLLVVGWMIQPVINLNKKYLNL